MAENSKIQWTDHTFNPWEGCTKVSPGCTNCYAEARNHRWGMDNWGKGKPRRLTSEANWKQPVKWNKIAALDIHVRPRVFCASLADWLDDEVPIEWLARQLKMIYDTPNLDWLMLTKRPENWRRRLAMVHATTKAGSDLSVMLFRWLHTIAASEPHNVWMGTTVEDQKRADERIPELLKIPARVRFLSVEPLLGPINFPFTCFNGADSFGTMPGIAWVIVGCEQLPGHKPGRNWKDYDAHAYQIIDDCRLAGVPVFHKQMPVTGRVSGEPGDWPPVFRVREFPE